MVSPKREEGRTEGWARGGPEGQETGGAGRAGGRGLHVRESRGSWEKPQGEPPRDMGLCCPAARLAECPSMFISKGFLFLIHSFSSFL